MNMFVPGFLRKFDVLSFFTEHFQFVSYINRISAHNEDNFCILIADNQIMTTNTTGNDVDIELTNAAHSRQRQHANMDTEYVIAVVAAADASL